MDPTLSKAANSGGKKGNPRDKDGKPLKCHTCGSEDHLNRECPRNKPTMAPVIPAQNLPSQNVQPQRTEPVSDPFEQRLEQMMAADMAARQAAARQTCRRLIDQRGRTPTPKGQERWRASGSHPLFRCLVPTMSTSVALLISF